MCTHSKRRGFNTAPFAVCDCALVRVRVEQAVEVLALFLRAFPVVGSAAQFLNDFLHAAAFFFVRNFDIAAVDVFVTFAAQRVVPFAVVAAVVAFTVAAAHHHHLLHLVSHLLHGLILAFLQFFQCLLLVGQGVAGFAAAQLLLRLLHFLIGAAELFGHFGHVLAHFAHHIAKLFADLSLFAGFFACALLGFHLAGFIHQLLLVADQVFHLLQVFQLLLVLLAHRVVGV